MSVLFGFVALLPFFRTVAFAQGSIPPSNNPFYQPPTAGNRPAAAGTAAGAQRPRPAAGNRPAAATTAAGNPAQGTAAATTTPAGGARTPGTNVAVPAPLPPPPPRLRIYSDEIPFRYQLADGWIRRSACVHEFAPFEPCDVLEQAVPFQDLRVQFPELNLDAIEALRDIDRELVRLEHVRAVLKTEADKWEAESLKNPSLRIKSRLDTLVRKLQTADADYRQALDRREYVSTDNASIINFVERLKKGFVYLGAEMKNDKFLVYWAHHLNRLFERGEVLFPGEDAFVFRCENFPTEAVTIRLMGDATPGEGMGGLVRNAHGKIHLSAPEVGVAPQTVPVDMRLDFLRGEGSELSANPVNSHNFDDLFRVTFARSGFQARGGLKLAFDKDRTRTLNCAVARQTLYRVR